MSGRHRRDDRSVRGQWPATSLRPRSGGHGRDGAARPFCRLTNTHARHNIRTFRLILMLPEDPRSACQQHEGMLQMVKSGRWKVIAGLGVACAVCCAPLLLPLLGVAGSAGVASAAASGLIGRSWEQLACEAALVALAASALFLVLRTWAKRKRSAACPCPPVTADGASCASVEAAIRQGRNEKRRRRSTGRGEHGLSASATGL